MRRYGLLAKPEVRETVRLSKGFPVRLNRAVGGEPGFRADVAVRDGRISFRAPSTFAGTTLLHFRASRGSEISEIATLTVTVTPRPAAPTFNGTSRNS